MKKFLTLIVALFAVASNALADVAFNETNFPDYTFRFYLNYKGYVTDGVITSTKIAGITEVDLSGSSSHQTGCETLQGIEYFTALKALYCSWGALTALDLSKNTSLEGLNCGNNSIGALGLSANTALKMLSCADNQLTSLDLSANTALESLNCRSNKLTSLIVSGSAPLTRIECYSNRLKGTAMDAFVASLPDVSGKKLYVIDTRDENEGNEMTTEQVAAAKAKGWVVLYHDGTDWKDYEGSTPDVLINETNFPDENFRNFLKQKNYGTDGVLTADEIAGITSLYVNGKGIKSLAGIKYFTELNILYCFDNQLESLNMSANTKIEYLNCSRNQLKGEAIDALIESLPNVEHGNLWVYDNSKSDEQNEMTTDQVAAAKLKNWYTFYYDGSYWMPYAGVEVVKIAINEANFPDENFRTYLLSQSYGSDEVLTEPEIEAIKTLILGDKGITDLTGIAYFTSLQSLACSGNALKTIDLSACTSVKVVICYANQIKGADMDAFISKLPTVTNGQLLLIDTMDAAEQNECTAEQQAAAEAKGWSVYDNNGGEPKAYEYQANGITSIAADTTDGAWYTLEGVQLEGEPTAPGIYVKDGRKVVHGK